MRLCRCMFVWWDSQKIHTHICIYMCAMKLARLEGAIRIHRKIRFVYVNGRGKGACTNHDGDGERDV